MIYTENLKIDYIENNFARLPFTRRHKFEYNYMIKV